MKTWKGKLKGLRRYVREINGVPVVGKKWVIASLSPKQLRVFEKKYGWKKEYMKCEFQKNSISDRCVCGYIYPPHLNPKKFKRYAYWWNLEQMLSGRLSNPL